MGILDNAKAVAEGIQLAANVQLYQQFIKLHGDIMDMLTENRNLHDEIDKLKANVALKAKMTFKAPLYYQDGDDNPFCPKCYEAEGKAMHLHMLVSGRWHANNATPSSSHKPEDHQAWPLIAVDPVDRPEFLVQVE